MIHVSFDQANSIANSYSGVSQINPSVPHAQQAIHRLVTRGEILLDSRCRRCFDVAKSAVVEMMPESSVTMDIRALHGLRGFAFLTVLLAHFSNHYDLALKGIGKVGVWIFFVLSAFLLTRQLLANGRPLSTRTLSAFFGRRTLRILPAYFTALLIFLLSRYLIDPENILGHLLFMDGAGHFWTVAVEVQFYVALPLISAGILLLDRRGSQVTTVALVCLWVMSFLIFPPRWLDSSATLMAPYLGVFMAGCIAAYVTHRNRRLSLAAANMAFVAIAAIIVVTIPSVWSALIEPVRSDHFYRDYALFSALAAGLVLCCLVPRSWCSTVFSMGPLRHLGTVSFSGYLMHPLALKKTSYLAGMIGTLPAMAISMTALIVLTLSLYYIVEKPAAKQMRRLAGPIVS